MAFPTVESIPQAKGLTFATGDRCCSTGATVDMVTICSGRMSSCTMDGGEKRTDVSPTRDLL